MVCQFGVLNRSLRKVLLQGSTLLQDCGAFLWHMKMHPSFEGMFYKIDMLPSLITGVGVGNSVAEGLCSGGFDSELRPVNRREV